MEGYNGILPTQVGEQGKTFITCKECGTQYQVTYHEKSENDTYTHKCKKCGNELFTETGGHGYSIK